MHLDCDQKYKHLTFTAFYVTHSEWKSTFRKIKWNCSRSLCFGFLREIRLILRLCSNWGHDYVLANWGCLCRQLKDINPYLSPWIVLYFSAVTKATLLTNTDPCFVVMFHLRSPVRSKLLNLKPLGLIWLNRSQNPLAYEFLDANFLFLALQINDWLLQWVDWEKNLGKDLHRPIANVSTCNKIF